MRILVTGASTGIGRATALRLAAAGHDVLAGVRKQADADSLSAAGRLTPVLVDVTDPAQVAACAAQVDGRLDGLVNNAGIVINGPVEFLDLDELRRQFEVNLFSQVAVTQALLPALRGSRGRIVNIGSIGGQTALPFAAAYTSSKAAIRNLTDALRIELAPLGVKVALVEPGSIRTEIWRKVDENAAAFATSLPPAALTIYGERMARADKAAKRTAKLSIPAERAAKVIESALTAPRPRGRYLVGPDARGQALIARLPARISDAVIGRLAA